jgi:hypothetical protein
MANSVSLGPKMCGKRTKALGSPQKGGFRITPRVAFHESFQVVEKSLISGFEQFLARPGSPDPSFPQKTLAGQFTNSFGNDTSRHPCYLVDHLEPASSNGFRLRGSPTATPFLIKVGPYSLKPSTHPVGHHHAAIMADRGPKVTLIYEQSSTRRS